MGQASTPPDWEAIARLLTRMHDEFGVPMTVTVYNSLLGICALSNDLVRAEELIDKMTLQGIQPNEQTLSVLEGKRALRAALKRAFNE
jgi:pentatricopeptide repeat protein